MKKQRLDAELIARGFFASPKEAIAHVMAAKITVNGKVVTQAGFPVSAGDLIETVKNACPYVSRGGLKLEHALKEFGINPQGKVCLDVGVSTGGFSDCFLQHGASLVYGVDVGLGQLHEKIAKNPNYRFYPNTNARYLESNTFNPKPAVAAIDVSFISLKMVLEPIINAMQTSCELAVLIKPQFELSKKQAPGGIVKNQAYVKLASGELLAFAQNELAPLKLTTKNLIESPVKGGGGNTELLWHIVK